MKKFICFVLMMLMIIGLCGCQTQSDTMIIPSEPDSAPTGLPFADDALGDDDVADITNTVDFVPIVVLDNDYVTITLTDFIYDTFWKSYDLKFYIENKTDQSINVTWENNVAVVNGYSMSVFFYTTLVANGKTNETVTLDSISLEENSIETIRTIDFSVRGDDSSTYSTIFDATPCSITIS